MSRLLLSILLLCLLAPAAMAAPGRMDVYVTVDWEGFSLEEDNIEAMQSFRVRFPQIPLLQFLNPVYFLRPSNDAEATQDKIARTLLPADTLGLHLHGWKSLMTYCGLPFHGSPAFSTNDELCAGPECGYTVSLEFAYSREELTQLIGCSARLLEAQGYGCPTSFRAGGLQQGPNIAAALQANGFRLDSSRTDAQFLTPRWGANSELVALVHQLHGGSTPLDQPYELLSGLTELPNNASLADYTSPQKILEVFRQLVSNDKSVMVLGFHQETAASYLHRLEAAIPLLEQEAATAGIELYWASVAEEEGGE